MVQSYLKYDPDIVFGVISSGVAPVEWADHVHDRDDDGSIQQARLNRTTPTGIVYAGANDAVIGWDSKTADLVSRWTDPSAAGQGAAVTVVRRCDDVVAVGHANGAVRLWDRKTGTVMMVLDGGHRRAVTAAAFDRSGTRLVTGSGDTDIVVWDLLTETVAVRMRGHEDGVVAVGFVGGADGVDDTHVLSAAKDGRSKVWSIDGGRCIETRVVQEGGHCWAIAVAQSADGFVTGGDDGELRLWRLDVDQLIENPDGLVDGQLVRDRGLFPPTSGRDRIGGAVFDRSGAFLAVHRAGKSTGVDVWRVRTAAEMKRRRARQARRRREKTGGETNESGEVAGDEEDDEELKAADLFVHHCVVRATGPVRSVSWAGVAVGRRNRTLVVGTGHNAIETFVVPAGTSGSTSDESVVESVSAGLIDQAGHRAPVRAVALSSDDRMVATAAAGTVKVWNAATGRCVRTVGCGAALAAVFLPGDRVVAVATKGGDVELVDVAASTLIGTVRAHDGPVWAIDVHPDGKSIVTGGADKKVKFWRLKTVIGPDEQPLLTLVLTRELEMGDDVLAVRFSPDAGRLIAIATLDSTVKVFFTDSAKLFLNLYGHKLPVLDLSISADGKLLATCSADKTVRLWGLDFGDCHRVLHGHSDSVMRVSFISHPPDGMSARDGGHQLFSASKDGTIRHWDGATFTPVQALKGHDGEIWALAVSVTGDFLVSASHDRSVRLWRTSGEPVFPDEEREKEAEAQLDDELLAAQENEDETAGPKTAGSLTAIERLAEALDLAAADMAELVEWRQSHPDDPNSTPPNRNPILAALGRSGSEHALATLVSIPPSHLSDTLVGLPASTYVPILLALAEDWVKAGKRVRLVCRSVTIVVRAHWVQIVAAAGMKDLLTRVRSEIRSATERDEAVTMFNLAGLELVSGMIRSEDEAAVTTLDGLDKVVETGRTKRAFVDVA